MFVHLYVYAVACIPSLTIMHVYVPGPLLGGVCVGCKYIYIYIYTYVDICMDMHVSPPPPPPQTVSSMINALGTDQAQRVKQERCRGV